MAIERIKPLPFQKGDNVKTPNGSGVVTAVGMHAGQVVYRVGRNQYWYQFQLTKARKDASHE
jgi:hypothetical protein